MAREIKFRVWDGEDMISPDYVDRDGYGHWKSNSIPNADNELMQFTGLHDRNGKEIFEGDIIALQTYADGTTRENRTVDWQTPSFVLMPIPRQHTLDEAWRLTLVEQYDGEVIGNIYENPELLAPKQEGKS